MKKTVVKLDRSCFLSDAEGHASQSYVLEVAKAGSWPKFGTMLLIVDLKALSLP